MGAASVNEAKIIAGNTSNWGQLCKGGNHESKNEGKIFF